MQALNGQLQWPVLFLVIQYNGKILNKRGNVLAKGERFSITSETAEEIIITLHKMTLIALCINQWNELKENQR